MIKTLVCPLSGHPSDQVALTTAFTVARLFDAHVDVFFAEPDVSQTVPLIGEGMSAGIINQIMRAAQDEQTVRLNKARATFAEIVAATGIAKADTPPGPGTANASWHSVPKREDQAVLTLGAVTDLIVLPTQRGEEIEVQPTVTLETALLQGCRPILVTTPTPVSSVGSCVAIAWNGKTEPAAAVAGAMPFLYRAAAVHVLTATPSVGDGGWPAAADLIDYLAWHGIEAQAHHLEPAPDALGEALMSTAMDLGADLLVMGGYGHSRMRELIFGGVTRFVLGHATIPVLMAH